MGLRGRQDRLDLLDEFVITVCPMALYSKTSEGFGGGATAVIG